MSSSHPSFRLKVQQIGQSCVFDLSWGQGQHLSAQVEYPTALTKAYQTWLRAYLNFYKAIAHPEPVTPIRGRMEAQGRLTPIGVDWQSELVRTEALLTEQFQLWLRDAALFELRTAITKSAQAAPNLKTDVYLVCDPIDLARLPWETWELGTEVDDNIRIARCPVNVRRAAQMAPPRRRQRTRVLAIMGDESGLDFQADRVAITSLAAQAEVKFVGWQPQISIPDLKQQICEAISDPQGWDILFFAGHSNETMLTGGELAIAPGEVVTIKEIKPYLEKLQARGLQLAIFNSCSGLSIAAALIDLGLSQVAVMREPIHNQVAQVFLGQFLHHLSQYVDAHDALRLASQDLKLEQSLSFPSAYLVPSFFRHPETESFRLVPSSWRQNLKAWLPTRYEGIALGLLVGLSLWPPLQSVLLDYRLWTQAIYRDLTGQVPAAVETPPVLLVQIDSESIRRSQMSQPVPMDRAYLAGLIDRLVDLDARIIGIDYLFDRQQPEKDQVLGQSIRSAIDRKKVWFVFASISDPINGEVGVNPETGIAEPEWSLEGNVNAFPTHVKLPHSFKSCEQSCPFGYLLSLLSAYSQEFPDNNQIRPSMQGQEVLQSRLMTNLQSDSQEEGKISILKEFTSHPVTTGASYLGQLWFRPIIDFSIPANRVFQRIPAWQLNGLAAFGEKADFSNQVVILAPGGYDGVLDNFAVPKAMAYWQVRERGVVKANTEGLSVYTGGEAHAYMFQHFLTQRLVVPIPTVIMVFVLALLAKGFVLLVDRRIILPVNRVHLILSLLVLTGGYVMISWQFFVGAAILIPCLFPLASVWIVSFSHYWGRDYA